MTTRLDPVTLEILWRRLLSIVDEADAAVARTAFSSPAIVGERESTVIVGEDAKVAVDEFGFLWIEMTDLTGLKDL